MIRQKTNSASRQAQFIQTYQYVIGESKSKPPKGVMAQWVKVYLHIMGICAIQNGRVISADAPGAEPGLRLTDGLTDFYYNGKQMWILLATIDANNHYCVRPGRLIEIDDEARETLNGMVKSFLDKDSK